MTWLYCERTGSSASTDGKYTVRRSHDEHGLFVPGLGRPLMLGTRAECERCAEVLESDVPLEELPPLRTRPELLSGAEAELVRTASLVGRRGAVLAALRSQRAPAELVDFEMDLLRRAALKLVRLAHEVNQ